MQQRFGAGSASAVAGSLDQRLMEYEFRRLWLPRTLPRSTVRRLLTDQAEYGGWELDRLRLFADGTRRVTLRRRIIRMRRTP
jgi:hypothetical protein